MLKENEHQNVLHCLYGCVSSREWGWGQVKNILKHGDYSGWGWTDQAEIIQVNT